MILVTIALYRVVDKNSGNLVRVVPSHKDRANAGYRVMAGRLLSSGVTLAVLATAATPIRRAAAMKQYVGLDVSQKSTNVCVVDEEGRRL